MTDWSNARILGSSHADDVALTVTSAASGFPATNLQTDSPTERWRSTSAIAQDITVDFAEDLSLSGFVLYGHNLSYDATIRLTIGNNADFSSPVYDATFDAVDAIYGFGDEPDGFGTGGFGGYDGSGWQHQYTAHWFPQIEGGAHFARYVRARITDTANTDGYVQAGRLMLGGYFTTTDLDIDYGIVFGRNENTEQFETRSGALRSVQRPSFRIAEAKWSYMTFSEVFRLQEILRIKGKHSAIFFSAYPDEGTINERFNAMLAFITDFTKVQRVRGGYAVALALRESL